MSLTKGVGIGKGLREKKYEQIKIDEISIAIVLCMQITKNIKSYKSGITIPPQQEKEW